MFIWIVFALWLKVSAVMLRVCEFARAIMRSCERVNEKASSDTGTQAVAGSRRLNVKCPFIIMCIFASTSDHKKVPALETHKCCALVILHLGQGQPFECDQLGNPWIAYYDWSLNSLVSTGNILARSPLLFLFFSDPFSMCWNSSNDCDTIDLCKCAPRRPFKPLSSN